MIESIIDSIIHISSTIACGYNGYIIELHRIQYIYVLCGMDQSESQLSSSTYPRQYHKYQIIKQHDQKRFMID